MAIGGAAAIIIGTSAEHSASGASAPIAVDLSEFAISPAMIHASAGNVVLSVTNSGTMVHNLSVSPGDMKTPDIPSGATVTLDLGTLAEGTFEVEIPHPGHADSGMKATCMVTAGDTSSRGRRRTRRWPWARPPRRPMPRSAAMDQTMSEGMAAGLATFTAGGSTQGVGNQKLAPTIEADGTKVFNLEASIIDWEVAPGQTVKAWAYNGMVPGPWIRTEPNDKVKIVLKNSLPVSTDIHLHGISTPFGEDGVAPLTQPVIGPGETYTYSWTNPDHPELGMYHAHYHGQVAVLNGMFAVFQSGDVTLPEARADRMGDDPREPQGHPGGADGIFRSSGRQAAS